MATIHSSHEARGQELPQDERSVAKAIASSVAPPGRKQSSAGAIADACVWARGESPGTSGLALAFTFESSRLKVLVMTSGACRNAETPR